ncbi:hypothetical protein [Arthrobacter burdickii]|uniref:Uncharacterized protein n=1 Tax=Arthrobacter burdickii TaxID=3035920 RepID=A0ABT8K3J8_9MICC|nr:hypothetical protein [Arthrobacter burdickii]MDN4611742.1 hypothetical protein [Arthrobacter burdickii]
MTGRGSVLARAALRGAAAGLVGTAAMTVGELVEQRITGRPDSHIPARTLRILVGRPTSNAVHYPVWNHTMHWATGATLGALRGIWSVTGIRGPSATAAHTVVRLAFDQTLENATGAGAAPSLWPTGEKVIDYLHKGVFAVVTGLASDAVNQPVLVSRAGARSH